MCESECRAILCPHYAVLETFHFKYGIVVQIKKYLFSVSLSIAVALKPAAAANRSDCFHPLLKSR